MLLTWLIIAFSINACNGTFTRLQDAVDRIPIPNNFQLANQGTFLPDRLHLIDRINNNLLFRGSLPIVDGEFAFDHLVQTMRARVTERDDRRFPDEFQFVVFTFINEKTESADLSIERHWFNAHTDKTKFVEMPVFGSLINPREVNREIRRRYTEKFNQLDDLPQRIEQIHAELSEQGPLPKIIYIHCEAGVDRTGEVAGGYAMRYQALSFDEALEVNNVIAGRNVSRFAKYGMQWYGYYLKEQLGLSSVGNL